MEGLPYNDQSLEKNWAAGHVAQSRICHVHCFSVIIQLCFRPLGCSSQLPRLQTSIHHPRQGTTRCGTDSSPRLATGDLTTQSSSLLFNFLQTCFKVGSPRGFIHWDYSSKKQKRKLCLFLPDRRASLLQGASSLLALEGLALLPLSTAQRLHCISTCKT